MNPTFGKNSIYMCKLLLNSASALYMKNSLFKQFLHLPPVSLTPVVHRTVQRELRWVKIGINRTARINCIAGKCNFQCPKGHHHESIINVLGGCSTFLLFDAIPTGWVSKHNSVGLIPLQRRYSEAVAAQRRSIPKCYVKRSL